MREPQAFGGGFADPVFQSQAVFRAVMDAMAKPGTIHAISCDAVIPPASLSPVVAALALTLCDQDTPVWLDLSLTEAPGVTEWLTFHTGASITRNPKRAAFAIVAGAAELPELGGFAFGTDEYPDRSTTFIAQMDKLSGGEVIELMGPGIVGSRPFAPHPLPPDFAARWMANNALFPQGVDLILCSISDVAALPRSTQIIRQAN